MTSPAQPIAFSYLAMAALSAVLMGTIGVISRFTGLDAQTVTFYRLAFAALLMLGYLGFSHKLHLLRCRPSWQVLVNGVLLASFILFYVEAMNHTSMANAIMIVYLAPIAASIVAHFFLRERLTAVNLLLIAAALFGFAMMQEFRLDFSANEAEGIGLVYALLSLCTYAGFIVINRLVPGSIHVFTRTWYQLAVGALCLLPFMLQVEPPAAAWQWGWLVIAGLFPGFLAILFAVMALRHLPAAVFGTLVYLEPIAVVLFGWLIFNETLSPLQMSGCLIILVSGISQGWFSTRQSRVHTDRFALH